MGIEASFFSSRISAGEILWIVCEPMEWPLLLNHNDRQAFTDLLDKYLVKYTTPENTKKHKSSPNSSGRE